MGGFHTFRHTVASRLFAEGRNVVQVQRWLGHHSPSFTLDTYVHLLDDELGTGRSAGSTPGQRTSGNSRKRRGGANPWNGGVERKRAPAGSGRKRADRLPKPKVAGSRPVVRFERGYPKPLGVVPLHDDKLVSNASI